MTKPWMGRPRDDWQIEVLFSADIGAAVQANATLWKFYSPSTGACFGSLATGLGLGAAIGVEVDVDGVDLSNRVGSAAGSGLNETLTIHRAFRPIDINGAYMNRISFGMSAIIELAAEDFTVYSDHDRRLFSFKGTSIGATIGAKLNILSVTRLIFNPPFELPESRGDEIARRRRQRTPA